jgi:hypothetical protein
MLELSLVPQGRGAELPTRRVKLGARGDPAASFFCPKIKVPIEATSLRYCPHVPFRKILQILPGLPTNYLTVGIPFVNIKRVEQYLLFLHVFFARLGSGPHEHSIGDESD